MFSGKTLGIASIGLVLCASSCGGGGGGGGNSNSILTLVQDLATDPTGRTTVVTFAADPGALTTANFDADNGQNATVVSQVANVFTVEWDAPVGEASQVRPLGVPKVSAAYRAVTSSDPAAPTFVITAATQVAGMGADTMTVQFSGARVLEAEAEDPANWTLKVGTTTLSLAGSTFTLDNNTQELSITTGAAGNLHAAFTLAAKATLHSVADTSLATTAVLGAAVGDAVAPTLVSVEQNLAEDEFGRVVDLTFSEAMDPVFCAPLSNFGGSAPDVATTFEQPSDDVLRITFNNPIVPGVNTIDLENLLDCHGNALPDQNVAVVAGSTVANGFASGPDVTTVEGEGGDLLELTLTQAIDPDDASDPARWNLEIPSGNAIDLSNCTFTYDMTAKSLAIELDVDVVNGASFTFEGAAGNLPRDVDGEDFTASVADVVSGEVNLPDVGSATQNRVVDPTGKTLDVVFSEALEETSAEDTNNYAVAGHVVQTATLLAAKTTVRLEFDIAVLPGTDTLDVSNVTDLAGNTMAAVLAETILSTDSTAPSATAASADAVEGAANDLVRVTFNDDLIESEIEDIANWTLQVPVGNTLNLAGATVVWSNGGRQASLTLPGGIDLQGGQTVRANFSGIHDIAGNAIQTGAVNTTVVAEVRVPTVDSIWVETALSNHVHVRFSEPCTAMDDLAGLTEYVVRTSAGVIKGAANSAVVDLDQMGVELVFGFAVVAGSDTLDLGGVTDLAGNAMFPLTLQAIAAEDATAVDIDGLASAVISQSGEANDRIEIAFVVRPSPWQLLDPSNYTITQGGNPVDLGGASFSFDGVSTVTIDLSNPASPSLQTGLNYDIDMSALTSAQGVAGAAISATVACTGDVTSPSLPAGLTRIDAANPLDSVLIQFDEAVDETSSENVANYDLNGGANPDSVVRVGANTVRATWSGGVIVGDTVNATVADLAGNVGVVSRAVSNQDPQGPLVVSVSATSVQGAGGDYVRVEFDKPIDLVSGLDPSNYTVDNAGLLALAAATFTYSSIDDVVTIRLPAGVELDPTQGLTVTVQDVADLAGLTMSPPANVGGAVNGDALAPSLAAAFVNYRADIVGLMIDVRLSEDVPAGFVNDLSNWTVSGGQTVDAVERLSDSHLRFTISAPLGVGDEIETTAMPDMAGNVSGAISIAPMF